MVRSFLFSVNYADLRIGRCDERFTGYGANKAACLFEMYLSGVSFYVLSDHFLIHQSHKYEEEARREEVVAWCFRWIIDWYSYPFSANTTASYIPISKKKHVFGAFMSVQRCV